MRKEHTTLLNWRRFYTSLWSILGVKKYSIKDMIKSGEKSLFAALVPKKYQITVQAFLLSIANILGSFPVNTEPAEKGQIPTYFRKPKKAHFLL